MWSEHHGSIGFALQVFRVVCGAYCGPFTSAAGCWSCIGFVSPDTTSFKSEQTEEPGRQKCRSPSENCLSKVKPKGEYRHPGTAIMFSLQHPRAELLRGLGMGTPSPVQDRH